MISFRIAGILLAWNSALLGELVCVPGGQQPAIQPDKHYLVRSKTTVAGRAQCLDKASESDDKVQVVGCNGTVFQYFFFGRQDANGCFTVHAIGSGQGQLARYLFVSRVLGGGTHPLLANPPQSADRWAVTPFGDGTFKIVWANNDGTVGGGDACIDRRTQDERAQVTHCVDVEGQHWYFDLIGKATMAKELRRLKGLQRNLEVEMKRAR